MFTLRKPTDEVVRSYLAAQAELPFSYPHVGMTRGNPPKGYDADRCRICLGQGPEVYDQAKAAVRRWAMFPAEMVELFWPDAAIEIGTVVAALFKAGCLWSLNPCRIVYAVDEAGDIERFGFSYGTLPGHLECGEERFTVEWHHADDSVWYELFAISRPRHWLARIGYPIVRREQKRFRELSGRSMQRSVTGATIAKSGTDRDHVAISLLYPGVWQG